MAVGWEGSPIQTDHHRDGRGGFETGGRRCGLAFGVWRGVRRQASDCCSVHFMRTRMTSSFQPEPGGGAVLPTRPLHKLKREICLSTPGGPPAADGSASQMGRGVAERAHGPWWAQGRNRQTHHCRRTFLSCLLLPLAIAVAVAAAVAVACCCYYRCGFCAECACAYWLSTTVPTALHRTCLRRYLTYLR